MVSVRLYRNFARENRLGARRYYVDGSGETKIPKAESEALLSRIWHGKACQPSLVKWKASSASEQGADRQERGRKISVSYLFLFYFSFFSFFFLSFWLSVLSFDRRRSDGVVGSGSSSGVPSAVNSDHGIQTHGDWHTLRDSSFGAVIIGQLHGIIRIYEVEYFPVQKQQIK